MPIYEYVCRQCGKELERLQKMSDDPLTGCPACGEAALKRKVSAAGFRLSGKGWYETDFKSDGQRNLAGNKNSQDSSGQSGQSDQSGSGSGSGSDKPAQKKEAAQPSNANAGADSA